MIVLDASALVLSLTDLGDRGDRVRQLLAGEYRDEQWAAPEHLSVEAAQAIRGLVLRSQLSERDARRSWAALAGISLSVLRGPAVLERIWQLRHNLSAYDAANVAVAESLHAPLLTADRRLASASGPRCSFVVV